jgi:hypothetical protein
LEKLKQFYTNNCEAINENLVYLKTDFEKIQIDINDSIYSKFRYLQLNNLVRFLNPKVNLKKHSAPQISGDFLDMEDLDGALDMVAAMEVSSNKNVNDSLEEMIPLYFLPSHIETKIKDITVGNKRRNIDYRLRKVLPDSYIDSLNLQFKPEQDEVIINYDLRTDYSISFFKFYKNSDYEECVLHDEIEKKVNEVKYKLNLKYVESMEHYFIGNIDVEVGLLERDEVEDNNNPLYYHFNLWKLRDTDLANIFNDFALYPFSKEVLQSEYR